MRNSYIQTQFDLRFNDMHYEINQVTESNLTFGGIIEHKYDLPQIRLYELILDISVNDFQKLWEFSYIATTSSSPTTPHYVVIFKDSSSICTCMITIYL
ncbi:unnamed protein product [Rhizophagus irregularis]|uniref:Uncharacterized protein n=1 Tax=Rhizophagus irregularis TaxID=588596 RepID=A0A915ZUP8_9GLOM|nr:unnamed protein product [Rhizophagus irregularis]